MKKEGLRHVMPPTGDAIFHNWGLKKDAEGSRESFALIEYCDGYTEAIHHNYLGVI